TAPLAAHADDAIALVRHWLAESREIPTDKAAQRLAGVLRDENGLAFTVGFVDGVVRPEDTRVAARQLLTLAALTPRFLPWSLRALIGLGGALAPLLPGIVVPISRRVLRGMVRHLIVDATDTKLGRTIARLQRDRTIRLN